MHAGETILVRVTAARAGQPVTSGQVVAEFWPPGQNPEHDPVDRARPYHAAPCAFEEASRRWTARVDTSGWPPGLWRVRGRVTGEDTGWAWSVFPLAA